MNKRSTLAILLVAVTQVCVAQKLDSLEFKIDKLTTQFNTNSPGCLIAIVKDGKQIFKKSYGQSNLEHGIPISDKTIFNIGSISKQFTAFLILQLEAEGRLNTTDRVNKFLPEYEIFNTHPITIEHLLFHTSGIREILEMFELSGIKRGDVIESNDVISFLKRQKTLNFAPGTRFSYSNGGYNALAQIIEKVTGQSFPVACRQRIFEPLNMTQTFVMDDYKKIIPNKATGYHYDGKAYYKFEPSDSDYGPGNIHTSSEDLLKWAANYSSHRIGKDVFLKFFSPGKLANGTSQVYGYGLYVDTYKGHPTIEMAGARMGHLTELLHFPSQNLTISIMSNTRNFRIFPTALQIAEYFLAEPPSTSLNENPPPTARNQSIMLPAAELKKIEGIYWNKEGDLVRKIYMKDETLFYEREPGNETELVPTSENKFNMKIEKNITNTYLILNKSNKAKKSFTLFLESGQRSDFEEVQPLNSRFSTRVTGSYYSDEADSRIEILSMNDSTIMLKIKRWSDVPMSQKFQDYYSHPNFGSILFNRDRNGKIVGLIVNSGKVRSLHFNKQ